jgi:hypothetical protein
VGLAIGAAALVAGGPRVMRAHAQELPPVAAASSNARAVAPADLTGYWVSVVTEDWIERMITPPRGEFPGVPLSPAGRQTLDAWDPVKDQATGNACRAYGAAGVMRQPGRLHVTWQDDNTLKIETEAGTQTRLLRFGQQPPPPVKSEPQWQGSSAARWMLPARGGGGGEDAGPAGGRAGSRRPAAASLKVVTTRMRPGYLRINGVPYGADATLTEYFDRIPGPNSPPPPGGGSWLIVTSVVEDSVNLLQPFITSTHFKLEPDGSKWKPRPCEVTLPIRGK